MASLAATLVTIGVSAFHGTGPEGAARTLPVLTGETAAGDRYEVAVTDDCVHIDFEDGRGGRSCGGEGSGLRSGTLVDRGRGRRIVYGFAPVGARSVSIRGPAEAWTLPVTPVAGGTLAVYAGALVAPGPSDVEVTAIAAGGRRLARERLRL